MAQSIVMYSTTSCPFCKMAKDFFQEKGIAFTDRDVTNDQEAQQEMIQKSGQLAVPTIDIDGQIVIGFNRERLMELLGVS